MGRPGPSSGRSLKPGGNIRIRQMIIPARKRYDRTRLTVPLLFVNKDKERISLISIYRQSHIPVRIVPVREYDP